MNETQIFDELNRIFNNFFKRDDFDLKAETVATEVPGWDSMTHVQIIIKIEKEFNIRFKHAEIAAFENVGDLVCAILRRKGEDAS